MTPKEFVDSLAGEANATQATRRDYVTKLRMMLHKANEAGYNRKVKLKPVDIDILNISTLNKYFNKKPGTMRIRTKKYQRYYETLRIGNEALIKIIKLWAEK